MRRRCIRFLFGRGLPLTSAAAFALFNSNNQHSYFAPCRLAAVPSSNCATTNHHQQQHSSKILLNDTTKRTRQTRADLYFQKHGEIPFPTIVHATLAWNDARNDDLSGKRILVIGDVHGCFEELVELYDKAMDENDGIPFQYVILVGDLGNKGPQSAKVIRHVRCQQGWLSVRGNHDDGALAAALGEESRRNKKKYQWVLKGESNNNTDCCTTDNDHVVRLSDDDVVWLSELPYTIRIPGALLSSGSNNEEQMDTVIVHAGLIPGVDLEHQSRTTMVTLREVTEEEGNNDALSSSTFVDSNKKHDKENVSTKPTSQPWASVWTGPFRVIFGHDARRGLQRYNNDLAIGLDTGACYGKKLTGIILPERKIVQVEARKVYCPIGAQED